MYETPANIFHIIHGEYIDIRNNMNIEFIKIVLNLDQHKTSHKKATLYVHVNYTEN